MRCVSEGGRRSSRRGGGVSRGFGTQSSRTAIQPGFLSSQEEYSFHWGKKRSLSGRSENPVGSRLLDGRRWNPTYLSLKINRRQLGWFKQLGWTCWQQSAPLQEGFIPDPCETKSLVWISIKLLLLHAQTGFIISTGPNIASLIFFTSATGENPRSKPRICSWSHASRCCTSWCTVKHKSAQRAESGAADQ